MVEYGRGFARMKKRLGPKKTEALRQQVLAEQIAMREKVSGEIVKSRDRDSYKEYPPTKRKP
jgi:hypothetical protein